MVFFKYDGGRDNSPLCVVMGQHRMALIVGLMIGLLPIIDVTDKGPVRIFLREESTRDTSQDHKVLLRPKALNTWGYRDFEWAHDKTKKFGRMIEWINALKSTKAYTAYDDIPAVYLKDNQRVGTTDIRFRKAGVPCHWISGMHKTGEQRKTLLRKRVLTCG